MSIFGFGTPCTAEIEFSDSDSRKKIQVTNNKGVSIPLCLFCDGDENESVAGSINMSMKKGKKVEHVGIRVNLIGQIEVGGQEPFEFANLISELAPPGVLKDSESFPFNFQNVEKAHESYNGINVRLRYLIRFTISRQYSSNIVEEHDFWVQKVQPDPQMNNSIKMEVGIEDCLHIEFEYNKTKYHLKDVVVGKVYFLLVRIKIKHMELNIVKRESSGSGPNVENKSETITKFEIMDGAPVRGESVPIRLFLNGFDVSPTFKNVHNKFSVKYYLNLVLVDEEDRRYFKQQEVQLWRK